MARRKAHQKSRYQILAIGASWGGVDALSQFVAALPPEWVVPIVIVQHQHALSGTALERILSRLTSMTVIDVDDKLEIMPRHIYIAPANYHLLVEADRTFSLSTDSPVNFSRPSIDVAFSGIAEVFGEKVIAILLTGANEDGVEGMRAVHEAGGFTIAQDPQDAAVATMPKAAIDAGVVDRVVLLKEMVPLVRELLSDGKE